MNNNFNINALNFTQPQRVLSPNVARAVPTSAQLIDKRNRKRRVLVWSDAVCATTGFGVVSKYILKALHATGKYEIDQLAINYFGDFLDTQEYPYQLQAARLNNPKDPYGNQQFLDALTKKPYDLVFVINDTFVVEEIAKHMDEIRAVKRSSNHPVFKLVYYFPVDCRYMNRAASFSKTSDYNIAYTDFAKESALKVDGLKVHDVIYHGTDTKTFRPLPAEQCRLFRKKFFNVDDDDKFILLNINRNNTRKDMARSILAFKEFRKQVPNSMMYMHTKLVDSPGWGHQIDLGVCLEHLALDMRTDVIFPRELNAANGFPVEAINQIYNAADAYITTTLGEGWGLTITEAMATGLPVIAPHNTSLPEILGKDGERGYMYPCREEVYVDNSGYRPYGRMEDIVETMMRCYYDWKASNDSHQLKIKQAREFTEQYSWDNVCKKWVDLFEHAFLTENEHDSVEIL